ncbi:MAG: DUF2306 domain-containing protein [Ferruginibacter sp.]
MIKRSLKILGAILATAIGLYPVLYFIIDRKFGLLQSKTETILTSIFWNTAFYTHIILGGLALLIGWIQFNEKIRINKTPLHRKIGKLYVICALVSATASLYIALYATGGIITTLGFAALGVIWFYTTFSAYIHIKNRRVEAHKKMMIYSYAACFAAVTLRIWLPLLTNLFHDFTTAYRIVAYLSWMPNLIVAFFIIKMNPQKTSANIAAIGT